MIFINGLGQKLYCTHHIVKQAKASMLIVHGLGEHHERYNEFVGEMHSLGINTYRIDLLGHGRSEGLRGHVDQFENYRKDIEAWYRELKDSRLLDEELPTFLFGHSLGGLICADLMTKGLKSITQKIDAVAFSSPAMGITTPIRSMRKLLQFALPNFLNTLYIPNLIDSKLLSHDKKVIRKYEEDPMVHNKITPAFLRETLEANYVLRKMRKISWPVPSLFLIAGADEVVDHEATLAFTQKIDPKLCEVKVFKGFYHEIFNERKKEEPYGVLEKWLKKNINRLSSSKKNNSKSKKTKSKKKSAKKKASINSPSKLRKNSKLSVGAHEG